MMSCSASSWTYAAHHTGRNLCFGWGSIGLGSTLGQGSSAPDAISAGNAAADCMHTLEVFMARRCSKSGGFFSCGNAQSRGRAAQGAGEEWVWKDPTMSKVERARKRAEVTE